MTSSPAALSNPFEPRGTLDVEARSLDRSGLDELDAWAQSMARHPQGGEWRKRGEKLVAEGKAGAVAQYAYAALLAEQGDAVEAVRLLVALCERLSHARAWPAIVEIARRALALEASPPAARWLVRAVDESGEDEARFLALVEAHDRAPAEPRIAWRLARLYEARGNREAALAATARSLEALARRHDAEGMEEALLVLLEEPDRDHLRLTLPPLPVFAKGGEVERVASFLELAWPPLAAAGLAKETWATLRTLLLELSDSRPLHALVPDVVEKALGAGARDLLAEAGFGNAAPAEWLPRFDKLLPFAPGRYAEHGSWGVGRVTQLGREEVWLDFPAKPGHRMTLRAAHQALTPMDPEDLAVLASWHPERLAELRARDPVDLVARALRRLGGSAATADLKRLFVRYVLKDAEWTAYWNGVRGRLAADPRIDATHAYQGKFALGTGKAPASDGDVQAEAASDLPLPRFDRGADAKRVLSTLKRFLSQHPGEARRLARERGSILRAWRDDESMEWKERLSALLLLTAGEDEAALASAPEVAGRAFAAGFEARELTTSPEQKQVLEWGLASSAWEDAARSGIASRFADVKERAFQAVVERLGERATAFFQTLARRAPQWPDAALVVADRAYRGKPITSPEVATVLQGLDPWEVALGLAELLESGPGETRAKSGVALLDPQGSLATAARSHQYPEETRSRLRRLFLNWRGSDRSLLPFLEWAEAAGLEEITAAAREKRHLAMRAITANSGKVEAHELPRTFLTRPTFDRLRREAEAIDQALRGEIPQAIQKARELGDLRENAEYESAKLKQRQASARLAHLARKMEEVSFIEDLEPAAGVAGLGTEVEIEWAGGDRRRLWILGEGDDHLGPEVVSYLAPLGRALLGRKPGDVVELPDESGSRPATVRSVRLRLP